MSTIQDVQGVLDEARALVTSLSGDNLSVSTPCEGWDVKALVEHMTWVVGSFARGMGADEAAGDTVDTTGAYAGAVASLTRQMHLPEALDQILKLPFGEMPAEQALAIVLADQMIHTWDLSKALGRPYSMNQRLAAGTLAGLQHMLTPDRRGPGQPFGPEVPCPADAPVQDRLLAFTGRHP